MSVKTALVVVVKRTTNVCTTSNHVLAECRIAKDSVRNNVKRGIDKNDPEERREITVRLSVATHETDDRSHDVLYGRDTHEFQQAFQQVHK